MGIKKPLLLLAILPLMLGYQNCTPMAAAQFDAASVNSVINGKSGPITVFMASGHMGRTLFSCDDGATWVHDQSANDAARCWVSGDPNYVECDHSEFAGRGLDLSGGAAYVNFGWGYNGTIKRSTDGVHWTTLKSDGWGGGIAAFGGRLISLWAGMIASNDLGQTWTSVVNSPAGRLDHPSFVHVGAHLIATANNEIAVSNDQGATWTEVPSFSSSWGSSFAEGNGLLVSVGNDALGTGQNLWSARSTDGGLTWTATKVYTADYASWSNVFFDGHAFNAFSNRAKWTSVDGITWSQTPLVFSDATFNPGLFTGPMSYNPTTGTYALITNVWANYYDAQKALRSSDGVHWSVLDAQHFKGGHPISSLKVGTIDASGCP